MDSARLQLRKDRITTALKKDPWLLYGTPSRPTFAWYANGHEEPVKPIDLREFESCQKMKADEKKKRLSGITNISRREWLELTAESRRLEMTADRSEPTKTTITVEEPDQLSRADETVQKTLAQE